MIGEDVKALFSGIWQGLTSGFKGIYQLFIKGINTLIGGANKLSFTAPEWVPGLGGKTIGFNLPTIPCWKREALQPHQRWQW